MITCTSCGHQFEPRDSTARPGDVIGCPACGSPLMMPDAQTLAYQEGTPIAVMSPVEQRPNAMSDQEVLPAGSMLGPYRIERFIGRGGMGSVYLATHTMLTRQVALKVLPLRFAKDAEFVERFRREALALASLSHPNIVAVHDMGTQGEISWLAMEFVEGPNLRDLLQSRKLPPEEALKIVPQLCDALEYAHSRGVIHRDIKPENILLAPGGVPKIADFGLAKMLKGEAAAPLTHTNIIMGTVEYMAPEQREKTKAVDHRADIFSMGVVLYEMLTGELPVGRFAPVSRKVAIDVRLDDVVLRALDADPNLRYQRASHLGTDVSAIAANARAGGGLEIREIGTDRVLGRVSGRRVVVRGPFKKVSLAGSGRPELLIDGNGQLKPGGEEAQIGANPGALLSLFVPRGVDVDIEGADGAISVEGLVGGLKAAAERGSVTVKRHDGPLEVHASKGGIEMESIRTARLTVRSGVGQVKIDDLLLEQGEGTVESVSGDISVRFDTAASARWQAHSADGDVKGPAGSAVMEHAGSGTVGAGQGRLTVTSSRGDVTISVGDLRHLMRSLGLQLPAWVSRNTFHTTLGLLALVIVIMVSGNGRAGLIVVAVSMAVVAHLGWKDWQAWTGKPPADPRRTLPPPVIPSVGTSGSPRLSAFAVASGAAGIVACLGFLLNIGIQIAVESGVSDAPYIALALGLAAVLCGLLALGIGAACVGHLREHAGALRGRAAGTFSLTAGGLAAGMALMLTLSYLHTMNDDAQAVRTFQSALASAVRDRSSKALDTWYPTDSVNLETRQAVRAVLDRLGERGVELAGGAWRYSDSRDRIAMTFEYAAPRREDRPAKEGMLYRVLLERRGRWWRLRGEKDVLHKLEEIDHELR